MALLFRWAFMQLIPQHAFAPLIARATIGTPNSRKGVGKTADVGKTYLDQILDASTLAKMIYEDIIKCAHDKPEAKHADTNLKKEIRAAQDSIHEVVRKAAENKPKKRTTSKKK